MCPSRYNAGEPRPDERPCRPKKDNADADSHVHPQRNAGAGGVSESLSQVYALRSLPTGWNGSDALPPSPASVKYARLWLEAQWQQCQTEGVRWYAPNVTADAEGNVVFEWWAEDRSLIVYVEDDSAEFHQSRDGDGSTRHTHGEAPLGQPQADLMRWFGE